MRALSLLVLSLLVMVAGCSATAAPAGACDDSSCVFERSVYVDPAFSSEERAWALDAIGVWNEALAGSAHLTVLEAPEPGNPNAYWMQPCEVVGEVSTHLAGSVQTDNRICMYLETLHWGVGPDAPVAAQELGYELSFARIAAHELGHVLGIPHSDDAEAMMHSGGLGVCVTQTDIDLFCDWHWCGSAPMHAACL